MVERRYTEVVRALLELVAAAEVGVALPPERELAARFGVARATLRRAIAQLVREGRLSSEQGRGTFVSAPPIAQPLRMTSFSEEMERRGLAPGGRVLWTREGPAPAEVAGHLEVDERIPVLEIGRLRTADGVPVALETLWVPAGLVPGLDPTELGEGSYYQLLAERAGRRVAGGQETIGAATVSGSEAELLEVPEGSAVLDFRRTTRADDGVVVEHTWSRYRADRYRIVADLELPVMLVHGLASQGGGGT